VVFSGWLLAAPPGASPDDGYHLGSIWCGAGFQDGLCVEDLGSPDPSRALIPQQLLALTCFTYDGATSAACSLDAFDTSFQRLVPSVTNLDGARPNLYYRTMNLLVGASGDVGAATMRIRVANAALALLMVLLTAIAAERRLRSAFLLSWVVAVVPLGLFLITSVNTSAWGLIGLTTAWANLITARDHPALRHRFAAGTLAVVGLTMGLGSRTEAVAHVGILLLALTAMWGTQFLWSSGDGLRRSTSRLLRFTAAAVGLAALVVMLIVAAPRSAGLDGFVGSIREGYDRIAARNVGDPVLAIAFEVPTLWGGALGSVWGLGALDTPIPSLASYPLMGVFVALVAVGLHRGARARMTAVTVLFVALFMLPTLSLLRVGLLVYEQLQPRQFMVLLFAILGIALHRLTGETDLELGWGGRIAIVASLGLAHSIALLVTIQRHTSGLLPGFLGEPRHVGFGRAIEWWWASAPHPDMVWLFASVAYIVVVSLVVATIPQAGTRPRAGAPA